MDTCMDQNDSSNVCQGPVLVSPLYHTPHRQTGMHKYSLCINDVTVSVHPALIQLNNYTRALKVMQNYL